MVLPITCWAVIGSVVAVLLAYSCISLRKSWKRTEDLGLSSVWRLWERDAFAAYIKRAISGQGLAACREHTYLGREIMRDNELCKLISQQLPQQCVESAFDQLQSHNVVAKSQLVKIAEHDKEMLEKMLRIAVVCAPFKAAISVAAAAAATALDKSQEPNDTKDEVLRLAVKESTTAAVTAAAAVAAAVMSAADIWTLAGSQPPPEEARKALQGAIAVLHPRGKLVQLGQSDRGCVQAFDQEVNLKKAATIVLEAALRCKVKCIENLSKRPLASHFRRTQDVAKDKLAKATKHAQSLAAQVQAAAPAAATAAAAAPAAPAAATAAAAAPAAPGAAPADPALVPGHAIVTDAEHWTRALYVEAVKPLRRLQDPQVLLRGVSTLITLNVFLASAVFIGLSVTSPDDFGQTMKYVQGNITAAIHWASPQHYASGNVIHINATEVPPSAAARRVPVSFKWTAGSKTTQPLYQLPGINAEQCWYNVDAPEKKPTLLLWQMLAFTLFVGSTGIAYGIMLSLNPESELDTLFERCVTWGSYIVFSGLPALGGILCLLYSLVVMVEVQYGTYDKWTCGELARLANFFWFYTTWNFVLLAVGVFLFATCLTIY